MKLGYMLARFFKRLKPNAIRDCSIDRTVCKGHGNQFVRTKVGRYTYFGDNCAVVRAEIGAFCSIAGGTTIGGGGHATQFVSSSPVFCKGRNALKTNFASAAYEPFRDTVIGNDVWIAARCLIKGGVKIGTGAVVGMGSVVTKDVPPYAIVAGNPARLIRYRFDEATVEALLESRWWEWPDEKLRELGPLFAEPAAFLEQIKK